MFCYAYRVETSSQLVETSYTTGSLTINPEILRL